MALSGTVAAYDVAPLLGALGLAREGSSGSESSPAAPGGETLVIRTATTITNVEHVRDLELADGRAAPDVRDACLSIIGDTPRSDPVLLYCLRPKSVKQLERDIAKLGRELSKVKAERHKVEAAILAADAAPPADREYDDDIEWEEDDEEDDAQVEADDFIFSDDDDSVGDFDSAGSTDSDADDSDIPDDA